MRTKTAGGRFGPTASRQRSASALSFGASALFVDVPEPCFGTETARPRRAVERDPAVPVDRERSNRGRFVVDAERQSERPGRSGARTRLRRVRRRRVDRDRFCGARRSSDGCAPQEEFDDVPAGFADFVKTRAPATERRSGSRTRTESPRFRQRFARPPALPVEAFGLSSERAVGRRRRFASLLPFHRGSVAFEISSRIRLRFGKGASPEDESLLVARAPGRRFVRPKRRKRRPLPP